MSPRIAILGTGSNGSCIAANLIDAGRDVVAIDQYGARRGDAPRRPARHDPRGRTHTVKIRAHHLCDIATFNEPFDVVLLAVKAYDTRWACELIKPHLKSDGMMIGMQNGMVADVIADVVGIERTVGCVIELSSEMFTLARGEHERAD